MFALGVVLSGCSLQQATQWIEGKTASIVKQDQQNEQGYVLTTGDVYAAYDTGIGYIKLENKGLVSVPDFCSLLDVVDQPNIRAISLMQNNIRIINADLSCLVNLRSLNLSYNQIEVVQKLGSLPKLQELRLQKNEITTTKWFPDLPSLSKLQLGFNQLKDISGLKNLTGLTILELYHNALEKLDGIEGLQKLEQLKVEYNKLTDNQITDVLKNLKNVSLFTAKGNEIKQALIDELDVLNKAWLEKNLRGGMPGTISSGSIKVN